MHGASHPWRRSRLGAVAELGVGVGDAASGGRPAPAPVHRRRELDVVESAVGLAPSSSSAWNYLLGLRDLVVPGELDAAITDLAKSAAEEAPWVTLPRACRTGA